jgi:DNA replication protein DnaC
MPIVLSTVGVNLGFNGPTLPSIQAELDGLEPIDKRGAELLFQVLTEREEKISVAIASNESFSGWTKAFPDPRLCAAIVDRLTFGANIIETGTQSYRLAHTKAQQKAAS